MRIVIDLQAAQSGLSAVTEQTLLVALSVARLASEHEVWVVLNMHFAATITPIRTAFNGVVNAERIISFNTPRLENTDGISLAVLNQNQQIHAQVRAGFLASLNPDIVFAPHIIEAIDPHVIRTVVPDFDTYQTVFLVGNAIIPILAADDATNASRQSNLQRAAGILTTSELARKSIAVLPDTAPLIVDESNPATILSALLDIANRKSQRSTQHRRSRLAFVSPLPPERSGIADYSAELIPELARYYDVELILDQPVVSDVWSAGAFPVRSVEWFESHAEEFDHVLYQIGNSPAHKHMFRLLERHPGIVVLHDFFLANVLDYLDHSAYLDNAFGKALQYSHGLNAVLDQKKIGVTESIWKYPCNKGVLDHAAGTIVHSHYPRQLAEQWYGRESAANWRTIPLLRGHSHHDLDRISARGLLQLKETDFIVCSFGLMGMTKCNEQLLDAWLNSPLALDPHCKLIFVGENDGGIYGQQITGKIAVHPAGHSVRITGFVSHEEYCQYLIAANTAVQLRTQTRGETSASVLDCLLHGLPTIVNAHGSTAELPDDVLLKIDDQFSLEQLSTTLLNIWHKPVLRQQLSVAARKYIATQHSPQKAGELYRDAIEDLSQHSVRLHYRHLLKNIGQTGIATEDQLTQVAIAIAANQPSTGRRQLLIDISALVQSDLKTGIQRVVRSIITALFNTPPAEYKIEPVYSPGGGEPYRYARHYLQDWLECEIPDNEDAPVEIQNGDIFLGLDLLISGVRQNRSLLQDYKNKGVHLYFVVYDILPVLRPDVFPEGTEAEFERWLHTISHIADGLVCISRAVADELANWLIRNSPARADTLRLGYFHLGADIDASKPSYGLNDDADLLLDLLKIRPSLLMVGTLEPRKGHTHALDAFEQLWAQGIDVNLVIVGKHGWKVDALAERLQTHPENGKRLIWLHNASDEMLLELYKWSSGLLAASEGEGFGLPLIEAAQHGLPIIARGIPVFREVMGEHAYYFDGLTTTVLADTIQTWLQLLKENRVPQSTEMRWLTWEESAVQLLNTLLHKGWHHEISPQPGVRE
ncbi:glycosyltransferase [Undibacterium sp. RuTC16W]|uniref:glycosyltransferase n=1 Tax=Undibacterium sp. RuTC16W TaxID=3413048 RepID=UPI003BF2C8DF